MVRRIWPDRIARILDRLRDWLEAWLEGAGRRAARRVMVAKRLIRWLVRPRDPNNLFVERSRAAHSAPAMAGAPLAALDEGRRRTTLLWARQDPRPDMAEGPINTMGVSLWRGALPSAATDAEPGAEAANRRSANVDLLAAKVRRLDAQQVQQLDELIQRLARKWLDVDDIFHRSPRRNRLDLSRTLRHNIPLYAGRVLTLKWAVKEYPVDERVKPGRILVIGDVSHSMIRYASIILYFFHSLNFKFQVDSYVFSELATHSAPFLKGLGTFDEKVARLVSGAKSWDGGTRFGSALEEIAAKAHVDENTYVLIASDGKVSHQQQETEKIAQAMGELRRRARAVIFLTPSAEFAGQTVQSKQVRLGTFCFSHHEIPVWQMGPPIWYGILRQYADRLYLVQTVQDLVNMTEDLLLS